MVTNLMLLVASGVLVGCGVFLLMERAMTRMLLGILLAGNGANMLLLAAGGQAGSPPIIGRDSLLVTHPADPLAQAMILTSIVISMAMTAFIVALAYRQYRYRTADMIADDAADRQLAATAETGDADGPDHPEEPPLDTETPPRRRSVDSPQSGKEQP